MKKIDYISLSRHFREETTDDENLMIFSWRDSNLINFSTYSRLKNIYLHQSEIPIEIHSKRNLAHWKTILDRIVVED